MIQLTDEQFDQLITDAMNELPQQYITGLENVVIVQADEPTPEQVVKMKIDNQHVLLGLYEGIPLTERRGGMTMLPDKITLFKHSILRVVNNESDLREQIKRTLWHEIAHYYGLNHSHIDKLQSS